MKLESLVADKKGWISSNGTIFNISFVPLYIMKLFINLAKMESVKNKDLQEIEDASIDLVMKVLESNEQSFKLTKKTLLKKLSPEDIGNLIQAICSANNSEEITKTISIWKPNIDKFCQIMVREYGITKEDLLTKYSWSDVQEYIHALPMERIITVYEHKDADNKGRFLSALCDKDVDAASEQLIQARDNFQERLRKAKNKK